MNKQHHLETARYGIVAGVAGGFAEIAWVTLYAGATGGNAASLAASVTTAAGMSSLLPAAPAATGVMVHMALAITLGIALAFVWRSLRAHRGEFRNPFPFMLAALLAVWAVNFLLVLPIVSPTFVHLVPYSVSLISKLLFGLAAAETLRRQDLSARSARRAHLRRSPS